MVSFAGIGSGLDLSSLVDSLVELEKQPIRALTTRKTDANRQLTNLGALVSRLKDLETAAENLDEVNEVRAVSATSSNEDFFTVSASDTAALGNYDLRVDNLAKGQVTQSMVYSSNSTGLVGTGSIGITVGTDTMVDVVFDGTEDLDGVAAKINASKARVTATVIFDGTNYRMMIAADDVGSANSISFQENSITMGLNNPGSTISAAEDAQLTLNGIAVTRSSNSISDLLQGVTINLEKEMAPTDSAENLRVDNDPDALRDKVQGFFNSLNTVTSFISEELGSGGTEGSATSLQGDSTLRALQRRLMSMLSAGYTHSSGVLSLGNVGVNLDQTGQLSIDTDKFNTTLQADPTKLSGLLAGDGVTSFTAVVKSLVDEYTKSGTGTLVTKQNGLRSRIDDWDDQIERIEDRASRMETRLRKTFAALDVKMAEMNNQSTYVAQAFGLSTS